MRWWRLAVNWWRIIVTTFLWGQIVHRRDPTFAEYSFYRHRFITLYAERRRLQGLDGEEEL